MSGEAAYRALNGSEPMISQSWVEERERNHQSGQTKLNCQQHQLWNIPGSMVAENVLITPCPFGKQQQRRARRNMNRVGELNGYTAQFPNKTVRPHCGGACFSCVKLPFVL